MPLTILQRIEKIELDITTLKLANLELQSHFINDEGGFEILDNQIHYKDINDDTSATYDLFDGDGNATDTYIVKKVLVSKLDDQATLTLDKSGGSEVVNNQQIYYDENGEESCRYYLYDKNGDLTDSEIFKKVLVE